MKYFNPILLSLLGMIMLSCSEDNDNSDEPEEDIELLIGTWYPVLRIDSNETFTLNECERQGRLIFDSNGNFFQTGFEENNSNECVEFTNSTGTWRNVSIEMYELTQGNSSEVIRISFVGTNLMRTFEAEEDYTEYQRTE